MTFLNLTPHKIVVRLPDAAADPPYREICILPTGRVARILMHYEPQGLVTRIPISRGEVVRVADLPGPQPDTAYIVSSLVLLACPGRTDVYAPDTGPACFRDAGGQVEAVSGFLAPPPLP